MSLPDRRPNVSVSMSSNFLKLAFAITASASVAESCLSFCLVGLMSKDLILNLVGEVWFASSDTVVSFFLEGDIFVGDCFLGDSAWTLCCTGSQRPSPFRKL